MAASDWFDALYLENYERMLTVAAKLLGSRESAEDVVQNTFLTLLDKQKQVRKHPNPTAWLYITLRNTIGNEIQREKYRRSLPLDSVPEPFVNDEYRVPFSDLLPEGLSEKELQILSLVYERELSYEKISSELGISVLACRTRLFRAKNKCKSLMASNETTGPSNNLNGGH